MLEKRLNGSESLALYDKTTGEYESIGTGWNSSSEVYEYIEENYPAGPGREGVIILVEVEEYP